MNELHRYSTVLGEVQAAVQQVRSWLDRGVVASRIAILAPDIEGPWPALASFLEIEGIAAAKAMIATAATQPAVQQLLSRLKIKAGRWDRASVESAIYAGESPPPYDEFERQCTHFYDPHQASKWLPAGEAATLAGCEAREFLDEIAKLASPEATPFLEPVIQKMLLEATRPMSWTAWLDYFERLLARSETRVRDGHPDGIAIASLGTADWLSADHMWILHLTEESLKTYEPGGLTLSEVLSLSAQTGFQLAMPDNRQKEFDLMWLLQRPYVELHLSTAATDLTGSPQAASLLWMQQALAQGQDPEKLDVPPPTRLRELQRAARAIDFNVKPLPLPKSARLSATQLEIYQSCPFVFAARKLFHLKDDPALDLDLDAMARGQLQHALLEHLLVEPLRLEWTDHDLVDLLERIKAKIELPMLESSFWPTIRNKSLKQAREFLAFEREWRAQFPRTTTVARELEIKVEWSQTERRFVRAGSGAGHLFTGRIDRVDANSANQMVLIDYKNSGFGLSHWPRWIESGQLQLALYWLAIEDGATELPTGEVVGAFYYILRDRDRSKGCRFEGGAEHGMFAPKSSTRNGMDPTEKRQFLEDFRLHISGLVERMEAGDFAPDPMDVEDCRTCHWSTLCRAPHLN